MASNLSLGLYIGEKSVVIAQVDSKGEWVERYGAINLPPGTIERGEVKNKEVLLQVIRELKKKTQPRRINNNERVVLGIIEQRVFLREFVVPKGTEKIDERIATAIRAILPTLPEEMVTDSMILGEDEAGDVRALLVAAPRRVVEDLIEVVQAADLVVERVETKMMAIAREIRREQVRGKDQMLVYQSETGLIMSYMTNGKVRFSSVIRLDEIERQGGITKVIINTVSYVNGRYPGREIQEVVVANGVGEIQQLMSSLAILKKPVVQVQSRLVGTFVSGISVMQPAIGLSMSGLDEEKDKVDLVPVAYKMREKVREIQTITEMSTLSMVIASLFLLIALGVWRQSLVVEEGQLRLRLAQYAESNDAKLKEELNSGVKSFNNLVEELTAALSVTGGGSTVMEELDGSLVPGVSLTGLLYERGITIQKPLDEAVGNYLVTGVADTRGTVLAFQDRLLGKAAFDDGRLYFGSLEKETEVLFRIVGGNGQKR